MASGSSLVSFGDRYAKLKKEKKIMAAGRKEKTINSWMMQHIELTYKNPNEKAEIYAICQGMWVSKGFLRQHPHPIQSVDVHARHPRAKKWMDRIESLLPQMITPCWSLRHVN
ncbi:uncharacterized protein LOC113355699 isoform X1 [Papaver somniferum]|uniref:uncharacterized protein LOC113355699 isoform X1 n=1 Tax=Papaver somniferum TaxID=3469 RepID=UPI000E6F8707|nr:uncharacterized protein LOC113355699 isoform X1 [Papaver somniferum]